MAKKYQLVPEDMIKDQASCRPAKVEDTSSAQVKFLNDSSLGSEDQKLTELLTFFPKNYKSRARVFLHYALKYIRLNADDQVVYEDGQIGSNIIDLARYFILPKQSRRPMDAPNFEAIVNRSGMPRSVLRQPAKINKEPFEWKQY